MTDSSAQKNTLRNSKQGQEAMPMPKDSGAMLICKVPVKTPMPCTVIVVHGVNDDGQFFPLVDQHICAGLNTRLGRDDLFPHKWGTWKQRSGATVQPLAPKTSICEEGRSPVIPFHWGYRPVDEATYRQDQRRYMAQLNDGNHNPDLPYSTYYLERQTATRQSSDNLGNWLSPAPVYAKDGGPYPNATTNLVDMWGPGPGGRVYEAGRFVQTDSAALMHDNPHRIYYVHAARRLADLIQRIRIDSHAGPDTINIIAHSQGTEIAMLANFMVVDAGQRPVDCLIMCHSPYGLYPTGAELAMPGRQQSEESRRTTLANFAALIQGNEKRSVPANELFSRGVATKEAWEKPGHGRSNFGNVYNYFCPQDSVVSLPNIQGIGWQGVDEETLEALGSNFYQRVFSDGHVVGTGAEKFELGKKGELAGNFLLLASETTRTINAPGLPATYTFHKQKNGPLSGNKLGEHLAGTALAAEGLSVVDRLVDKTTGAESPVPANLNRSVFAYDYYPAAAKAELATTPYPYVEQIRAFRTPPKVAGDAYSNCIVVRRTETPEEALSRFGERPADWSQHSAITLHPETIEKCMAYDLAIGLTVAYDDEKLWWELIHRADWRSEQNPDKDATEYYSKGILPPDAKLQMNKPKLPAGVVSHTVAVSNDEGRKTPRLPLGVEASTLLVKLPPTYVELGMLWPLPEPDVRG